MSLIRAVTAGTLVGAAAALGIFVAVGPDDLGRAAAPAAPTFAPVPTPTVTQLADCTPPAVLTKGVCVTTEAGPEGHRCCTVDQLADVRSAHRSAHGSRPRPGSRRPRATAEQRPVGRRQARGRP